MSTEIRAAPAGRRFLPRMGREWLLPLYDPFTRLIGIESAHRRLAGQAQLDSAERVLEIGCGTGNLTLLVKRSPHLDVVLSSLMFHHLDAGRRVASLREVLRVLGPGGSLHLMDFGGDSRHVHGLARLARRSPVLEDNWDGRIPALMGEAGFSDVSETGQLTRRIGRLAYYRAARAQ